jgi:SPP1 gp7 family putative phage head morphogenesis protein
MPNALKRVHKKDSVSLQEFKARRTVFALIGMPHKVLGKSRKRLPRQTQPEALRLEYFMALRDGILKPLREALQSRLAPKLAHFVALADAHKRQDAPEDDLRAFIEAMAEDLFGTVPNEQVRRLAASFGRRVSVFQREQLQRQMKAALGIDVVRAEPFVAPIIESFAAENVSLIKSIPRRFFDDLEKQLVGAVADGKRPEELQQILVDRYGVAESSAKLVARDQIGKLYGELNQARQEDLGIKGYFWRGVQDNREREEHEVREGRFFEWDDPPEDGHPGEPVNCRCYAEPDFSPILDSLET